MTARRKLWIEVIVGLTVTISACTVLVGRGLDAMGTSDTWALWVAIGVLGAISGIQVLTTAWRQL